jgi:hypothetical protein
MHLLMERWCLFAVEYYLVSIMNPFDIHISEPTEVPE